MYKHADDDHKAELFLHKIQSFSSKSSSGLTLRDALFNPQYRKATYINLIYIMFHELTGINIIN